MYLKKLGETIKATSLCGLGQTAPNPVLSTLQWFRDEYEAHVFERRCPAGACKELVGAPCQNACPAGTEVWRYVAHIARGEYEEAYRVIREANPFPSACARVCHHPCEYVCRAGATGGEPIAIRTLKRFVVDHVNPADAAPAPAGRARRRPHRRHRRRPSGLTAAHYLCAMGYRVTVFEREDAGRRHADGRRSPSYRLPARGPRRGDRPLLTSEHRGATTTTPWAATSPWTTCWRTGYKAVYLATGSHQSQEARPARRGRRRASSRASSSSRPTTCTGRSWPAAASASSAAATPRWTPPAWPSASRA